MLHNHMKVDFLIIAAIRSSKVYGDQKSWASRSVFALKCSAINEIDKLGTGRKVSLEDRHEYGLRRADDRVNNHSA